MNTIYKKWGHGYNTHTKRQFHHGSKFLLSYNFKKDNYIFVHATRNHSLSAYTIWKNKVPTLIPNRHKFKKDKINEIKTTFRNRYWYEW